MNWNEVFTYDLSSGILTWKPRLSGSAADKRFNTKTAGKVAGAVAAGKYNRPRGIAIGYRGKDFYAHRIVWEMHNGEIPIHMVIDHINGDATDNRLTNLRLATREQNYHNQGISLKNTSGIKGVHFDNARGLWKSEIRAFNRVISLGRFKTKGMAAVARAKAALRYHGEFARI